MHTLFSTLCLALPFLSQVAARPDVSRSFSSLAPRADSPCSGNTASTRSTWCDYSTSTNYYTDGPTTGVTREYWLVIEETTKSVDGYERYVQLVNGTLPGPTIEADWGDEVIVHVQNSLKLNGTGIHFHGIRQNYTNENDGVPAVVQCPVAPGQSITYQWKATQYGSSWYHSHFAVQAWEGVFGGIVIHGPATANYDHDLGNLFLNDWDHQTVDELYSAAETQGPIPLGTGLINGTNTYPNDTSRGARFQTSFDSGSSYLLRVVNGAIDAHWDFSIDNHTLQVIATDFVPIKPYTTKVLSIGIGQRYDVVVTADQAAVASDFWLRANPDSACGTNNNAGDIRGIVHYGSSTGTPAASEFIPPGNSCQGEAASNLVPYLALDASTTYAVTNDSNANPYTNAQGLFRWTMGPETFLMDWKKPTITSVLNGSTAYGANSNAITLDQANEWMMLIVETTAAVGHPIHLHGHDFFVLASGNGTYANAAPALATTNPPRRDTTMLPANGYLVVAFQADNPGIWLAHCHIGWHASMGLALQVVERYSEIAGLYNKTVVDDTCSTWESWQNGQAIVQNDSGI
ncbi:multicopper oxidase [Myriangium duriaei CBS 260.36]|uniref:Multicopper oxidase n=1 Tax=Myriangium duriaei CBS 260.36 TaxID=1168546 RepID=A0A9P4IUQ0_9PEZI|nr:multicopper oxidase [Myriangium duriaei CBS 260.36]